MKKHVGENSGGGFQGARLAVAHLGKKEDRQDYVFAHLVTRGGPLASDTAPNEFCPAGHFQWRRPQGQQGGGGADGQRCCERGVSLPPFVR